MQKTLKFEHADIISLKKAVYRYEKISQALLEKALAFSYVSTPCVITLDKNPAYPVAIKELKEEKRMPESIKIGQVNIMSKF